MNERETFKFGANVASLPTWYHNTPTTTLPTGHYAMCHTGPPNQSKMFSEQSSKKLPSGTSFHFGQNTAPLIVDTPLFRDHQNAYYSFSKVFAPNGLAAFWSDWDEKISLKEAPKIDIKKFIL